MAKTPQTQSYGERSLNFTNPTAKLLLETMERKKSNLAVSVDVTDKGDLLSIIEAVAPFVCMIKVNDLFNNTVVHILMIRFYCRLTSTSSKTLTFR
jgi:orotidine-5'-phosphate decarboxylase